MKIRHFLDKRYILKALKTKYRRELQEMEISKKWITECIIDRKQEFRRPELIKLETQIKEQVLFLEWLETQSVFK